MVGLADWCSACVRLNLPVTHHGLKPLWGREPAINAIIDCFGVLACCSTGGSASLAHAVAIANSEPSRSNLFLRWQVGANEGGIPPAGLPRRSPKSAYRD